MFKCILVRLPGFHQENSQDRINKTLNPTFLGLLDLLDQLGLTHFSPVIYVKCFKLFLSKAKKERTAKPRRGERKIM